MAFLICWALVAAVAAAETRSLTIDPAGSRVSIQVDKSGLFKFAGHAHQVDSPIKGRIVVDQERLERSTVRIEIDAAALKVSGKGEPAGDVPKVQQTMETSVLDIARYPAIVLESTSISVRSRRGSTAEVTLDGRLTLHGVTRPVSVPVSVEIGADQVKARGQFSVKQTDYGIKPVSVAAVVNVKDALGIEFTIIAR